MLFPTAKIVVEIEKDNAYESSLETAQHQRNVGYYYKIMNYIKALIAINLVIELLRNLISMLQSIISQKSSYKSQFICQEAAFNLN